jgi:hypothetical protein
MLLILTIRVLSHMAHTEPRWTGKLAPFGIVAQADLIFRRTLALEIG